MSHYGVVSFADGLRERKKRQMRQNISDIATGLFLERGFDGVTVAEIAASADVSEKTVFNYFPNKESLLLDREPHMTEQIQSAFGPNAVTESPIKAALEVLESDLEEMLAMWKEPADVAVGIERFQRFLSIMHETPALRAAQQEMVNRMVQVTANALAERAGVDPETPEPQIAATALMGLWNVQFRALHRIAEEGVTDLGTIRSRVNDDVRRAARLLDTGLWSFGVMVTGATGRAQLAAAAQLADRHRKQVLSTMREARRAWELARHDLKHELKQELNRDRQRP